MPHTGGRPKRRGTDELDVRIMAILETQPAATNISIAAELKLDRETVASRRARPDFKAMFAERNLPPIQILRNAQGHAAKTLVKMMVEAEKDADRIRAAEKILGPDVLGAERPTDGPVVVALPDAVAARVREAFGWNGARDRGSGGARRAGRRDGAARG